MKIEENEKAGNCWELNPEHLSLEPPVLGHWATTTGQPPTLSILYILHRWYWMSQLHTWQALSMYHQNSIRGWQENSLHQEKNPWWMVFLTLPYSTYYPPMMYYYPPTPSMAKSYVEGYLYIYIYSIHPPFTARLLPVPKRQRQQASRWQHVDGFENSRLRHSSLDCQLCLSIIP